MFGSWLWFDSDLKPLVLLGRQLLVGHFGVFALVYINDLVFSKKLHFILIYLFTTYIIHPSKVLFHLSVDPSINSFIHLASDWCIHQFIDSFILHRSMHPSSRRSRKLTLDSEKATSLAVRWETSYGLQIRGRTLVMGQGRKSWVLWVRWAVTEATLGH